MINFMSYIGVNLQSELCLWTLMGILTTIFDATLFKVNANLKQVWQMEMPTQLSMPVQRVLRTTISGVMLVQCFTVYVYLAAYVVLLYPVFLEERPSLVLPWLLLAAIRKFLCELTSLALGLGVCVLLGPARPPCIKFLVFKVASIMPAFYMWMMVYSYYNVLRVAATYKRFPMMVVSSDHDYGLELAVRRRCTKSLLGEEQLRKKLTNIQLSEKSTIQHLPQTLPQKSHTSVRYSNIEIAKTDMINLVHPVFPDPDIGASEDWCGNDVIVHRVGDRIMEQFIIMLLRIGVYLKSDEKDLSKLFSSHSREPLAFTNISALRNEGAETPPSIGNTGGKIASYLHDYPKIFQKKPVDISRQNDQNLDGLDSPTDSFINKDSIEFFEIKEQQYDKTKLHDEVVKSGTLETTFSKMDKSTDMTPILNADEKFTECLVGTSILKYSANYSRDQNLVPEGSEYQHGYVINVAASVKKIERQDKINNSNVSAKQQDRKLSIPRDVERKSVTYAESPYKQKKTLEEYSSLEKNVVNLRTIFEGNTELLHSSSTSSPQVTYQALESAEQNSKIAFEKITQVHNLTLDSGLNTQGLKESKLEAKNKLTSLKSIYAETPEIVSSLSSDSNNNKNASQTNSVDSLSSSNQLL